MNISSQNLVTQEGNLKTVDRKNFAIQNFSPVAWVAKIKHAKIFPVYGIILVLYTYTSAGGKATNISYMKKKIHGNFPIYSYTVAMS